jgi:hypothetical protein
VQLPPLRCPNVSTTATHRHDYYVKSRPVRLLLFSLWHGTWTCLPPSATSCITIMHGLSLLCSGYNCEPPMGGLLARWLVLTRVYPEMYCIALCCTLCVLGSAFSLFGVARPLQDLHVIDRRVTRLLMWVFYLLYVLYVCACRRCM